MPDGARAYHRQWKRDKSEHLQRNDSEAFAAFRLAENTRSNAAHHRRVVEEWKKDESLAMCNKVHMRHCHSQIGKLQTRREPL